MRSIHCLLLLVALSFLPAGCRDDGLGVPGASDLAGPPDLGEPPHLGGTCAAYTDGASCRAHPQCEAATCPGCMGAEGFVGCYARGKGPSPVCPAIACAADCAGYTDEQSCDQAPGCASVFQDQRICACPKLGCCMLFDRCVSTPVSCSPTAIGPACTTLPTDCGPDLAPIFDGPCQIGCARAALCESDCRSAGCTPGFHCDACFSESSWICLPDGGGNPC